MSKTKKVVLLVLTAVIMLGAVIISVVVSKTDPSGQTESGGKLTSPSGEMQTIEIEDASYSIPKEAVLNEGYKSPYSGIVYVDYTLNGVRFIDSYLPDGTVSTTTTDGSSIITYSNGTVESMPIPKVETN